MVVNRILNATTKKDVFGENWMIRAAIEVLEHSVEHRESPKNQRLMLKQESTYCETLLLYVATARIFIGSMITLFLQEKRQYTVTVLMSSSDRR